MSESFSTKRAFAPSPLVGESLPGLNGGQGEGREAEQKRKRREPQSYSWNTPRVSAYDVIWLR